MQLLATKNMWETQDTYGNLPWKKPWNSTCFTNNIWRSYPFEQTACTWLSIRLTITLQVCNMAPNIHRSETKTDWCSVNLDKNRKQFKYLIPTLKTWLIWDWIRLPFGSLTSLHKWAVLSLLTCQRSWTWTCSKKFIVLLTVAHW